MAEQVEQDKLFEHEYDGIKEYDNPMPRWWVWLFWATIIFCIPYTMWFHLSGPEKFNDRSIQGNLEREIAAYGQIIVAQYGDLTPDEPTILSLMVNPDAMAAMKSLFNSKCASCHADSGAGNVGPNLTDDHWIEVREVVDIPETIRNGRIERGMPAWGNQFSETQITLLSAYVASLRQDPITPDEGGKRPEPQAREIPPWPAPPASAEEAATDLTGT